MDQLLPTLLNAMNNTQQNTTSTSSSFSCTTSQKPDPRTSINKFIEHVKFIIPKQPRLVKDADKHIFETKDKSSEKYSTHHKSHKYLKIFESYVHSDYKMAEDDIRTFINANSDAIMNDTKLSFLEKNTNIYAGFSRSTINTKSYIPLSYAFKLAKSYKKIKSTTSSLGDSPALNSDTDYNSYDLLVYYFLVMASSLNDKVYQASSVSEAINQLSKKYNLKAITSSVQNNGLQNLSNKLLGNIKPEMISSLLKEFNSYLTEAPKILEQTKKEHGDDPIVKTIENAVGGQKGLETLLNVVGNTTKKIVEQLETKSDKNIMDVLKDTLSEQSNNGDIQKIVGDIKDNTKNIDFNGILTGAMSSLAQSGMMGTGKSDGSVDVKSGSIEDQIDMVKGLLEEIHDKKE